MSLRRTVVVFLVLCARYLSREDENLSGSASAQLYILASRFSPPFRHFALIESTSTYSIYLQTGWRWGKGNQKTVRSGMEAEMLVQMREKLNLVFGRVEMEVLN